VFYDADGQMDIKDMAIFNRHIAAEPYMDVWQGSRFVSGGEAHNIPLHRRIILW